jgi:uncharacterized membrane protein
MRPPKWLSWCVWTAVAVGVVLRFTNLEHKVFWQDEAFIALHVTGHLERVELRSLFDGRVHPIADLQRLQARETGRGFGSTLHALALEDADQGALYYIAERAAIDVLGTSFAAFRFAGALFGGLAIAFAFLLGAELFESPASGALFAAVIALSPFEVLYAHEARGYTLTILMTLVISWLLLVALRRRQFAVWVAYAACATLALYANAILGLVLVTQLLYVILTHRRERAVLLACISANVAALALFVPWMIVMYSNRTSISEQVGWGAQTYPFKIVLEKWLYNISAQFFDLAWLELKLAVIGGLILVLSAYAIYYLIRYAKAEQSSFVIILGATTMLAFGGRDLVEHAHWSTTARYLIPTWLALQLSVAYLLAVGVNGVRRIGAPSAWAAITVALLVCEAWSSVVNTQADSWYNNALSAAMPSLAATINLTHHPLLVGEHSWAFYLAIAPYLNSDVSVQLFREPHDLHVAFADHQDVFVPTPSSAFAAELQREGFALRPVYLYQTRSSAYEQAHAALRSANARPELTQVPKTVVNYPSELYVLEKR